MCTMSNLDKRWHGSDLISVQCTNDHILIWWRDLMALFALSKINTMITLSHHCTVSSIYIKYVAGHLLELQIFSDCPLHDIVNLPYQILLKMPMADITLSSGTWLWYDGSSIPHSRFNVQVQILQSSTKILSKILYFHSTTFIDHQIFCKI